MPVAIETLTNLGPCDGCAHTNFCKTGATCESALDYESAHSLFLDPSKTPSRLLYLKTGGYKGKIEPIEKLLKEFPVVTRLLKLSKFNLRNKKNLLRARKLALAKRGKLRKGSLSISDCESLISDAEDILEKRLIDYYTIKNQLSIYEKNGNK